VNLAAQHRLALAECASCKEKRPNHVWSRRTSYVAEKWAAGASRMIITWFVLRTDAKIVVNKRRNLLDGGVFTMQKFKQDTRKFKELILYISEKCATDSTFGATKLNKILFLADFWSYARLKKPITGVEYMRLPKGPAPRPLVPIRNEMVASGELAIQETAITEEISRKRPINLRSADLSVFDAKEIALVDQILAICTGITAVGMSNYTHSWHGWIAARNQETIPYETVFISDDPITPFEMERGRELAKQYGWQV
jgi:hypothetical protein